MYPMKLIQLIVRNAWSIIIEPLAMKHINSTLTTIVIHRLIFSPKGKVGQLVIMSLKKRWTGVFITDQIIFLFQN